MGSPQNLNMDQNSFSFNAVDHNLSDNQNLETLSYGGAFFYTCLTFYDNCDMTMTRNNFLNNTSEITGGAIKYDEKEPNGITASSNSYTDNYAKVYGNHYASYAQRITKKQVEDDRRML